MTADLLTLSARFIDEGVADGPVNRVTGELSELADDLAVVEAFSHVIVIRTAAGLVLFDTSAAAFGPRVQESLRAWTDDAVAALVYTHGHVDHVGGAPVFIAEAEANATPRPRVIGHENVVARFDRYDLTNGYNGVINHRQFGRTRLGMSTPEWFSDWVRPDTVVGTASTIRVGDLSVDLRHSLGETDDHLWGWLPDTKTIIAGDFLTWVFPNAGNPQKVQRYPAEWAKALRDMAALEPELLIPAHGLPIGGKARIATVLDDVARALETLVDQTLRLMNEGARLDDVIHAVRVPDDLMAKPYLAPVYDEPEFVVRNIWRLYGGWYDGNPARLKPAPDALLAAEIAALAGGSQALADRAAELSAAGDHRVACQLVEWATQAAPDDASVHEVRAAVYLARRRT
ncbi:MAG: alkyl sulfatase dimerization domain-containing protein, partial [Acidimicrobiales bacterium]